MAPLPQGGARRQDFAGATTSPTPRPRHAAPQPPGQALDLGAATAHAPAPALLRLPPLRNGALTRQRHIEPPCGSFVPGAEDGDRGTAGSRGPSSGRSGAGRRGWTPCTRASPTGSAGRRCGRGPGATWPGCWAGRSARTAGSWPRSRGAAPPRCSASWTRRAGTRMPCGTTCAPTSWSTWATRGRCWSSTRPGSSRRGPSRSACSASTAGRRGAGRTPRWRLPGLRRAAGPRLPGPRALPAPELGRRQPARRGGRGAVGGTVRHEAAAGPGDAPAGVRGGGAGGLGGRRHGVRHGPGAAAVAGGGAPRLRPGGTLQAPGVDGAAGRPPRGRRWPGSPLRRGRGARPGRGAKAPAGTTGSGSRWRVRMYRGGGTGCWPAGA